MVGMIYSGAVYLLASFTGLPSHRGREACEGGYLPPYMRCWGLNSEMGIGQ